MASKNHFKILPPPPLATGLTNYSTSTTPPFVMVIYESRQDGKRRKCAAWIMYNLNLRSVYSGSYVTRRQTSQCVTSSFCAHLISCCNKTQRTGTFVISVRPNIKRYVSAFGLVAIKTFCKLCSSLCFDSIGVVSFSLSLANVLHLMLNITETRTNRTY